MTWDFRVGMKVVCINTEGLNAKHGETLPKKGSVYTIREIIPNYYDGAEAFRLVEIVNSYTSYEPPYTGEEAAWRAARFRPLEEKPDAIEVFRAIALDPQRPLAPGGDGLDVRVPDDVHAFGGRPIL